jgi:hypothetical protein
MKITLANGTELHPISVIGEEKSINGTRRDTLTFVFPQDIGLDELDALFTAAACEKIKLHEIKINEDGSTTELEHIHTGYTIRAGLSRTPIVTALATDATEEVVENRVMVSMARRTYAETQLAMLAQQSAMHEECIVELASIIYA